MENNDRIDKIRATVLYIASEYYRIKNAPISMHQLSKILYFADQRHLVKYGRTIISDDYIAMRFGPVPSLTYNGVKAIKGTQPEEYKVVFQDSISVVDTYIKPLKSPDMDEFSESDIECVNFSLKDNIDLSFIQLTEKSHKSAWEKSSGKISLIDIAIEAGADAEMLKFISETN